MRFFITAREYRKSKKLIETLQEQLDLQRSIDGYKDELMDTLKSLIAYKESAIDHLKGKIQEMKKNE